MNVAPAQFAHPSLARTGVSSILYLVRREWQQPLLAT
jgi:hypothetical protein